MFVKQAPATICMSPDGYFRLSLTLFLTLMFEDRARWTDDDLREDLLAENMPVTQAGFCEWQSGTQHTPISLGWAWYEIGGKVQITSDGVSSNVMFVDPSGKDLGCRKTQSLLKGWLSLQPWSEVAARSNVGQVSACHAAKAP